MEILENTLGVSDYVRLWEDAGWGDVDEKQVEIALQHSTVTFALQENGQVIGMARLLGDEAMAYFLKDFVIDSRFREQGYGRKLMDAIVEHIKAHSHGYEIYLDLASAGGKEGFYEKCGFMRRPYDWHGAGMLLCIHE